MAVRGEASDSRLESRGHEQRWRRIVDAHVARSGSNKEFVRLAYTEFCRSVVFRTANLLLACTADAEEVTHEVFIRLYLNVQEASPKKKVDPYKMKAWLRRTSFNLANNRRRSVWSRVKELEDKQQPTTDSGLDPRVNITLDAVRLLAMLPEQQQDALVLKHCEGLEHDEISKLLRVSVSTVTRLLANAKARLREISRYDEGAELTVMGIEEDEIDG